MSVTIIIDNNCTNQNSRLLKVPNEVLNILKIINQCLAHCLVAIDGDLVNFTDSTSIRAQLTSVS